MPALTDEEKAHGAAEFTRIAYGQLEGSPVVGTQAQRAAIASIATAMDTVINEVPAGWVTKTFEQAMVDNLPDAFRLNSTATEKALILAIWAIERSGAFR